MSKLTVIWVANRDRPVLEPPASHFALSDRGELVLFATPSNTVLWSSNATSPSARTAAAMLQDDGNLVVLSDATSSSLVTWQSFDHPTDTWLPGANLGYDRARGVHSFLTSWTDAENPAPGAFSMVIDPHGQTKLELLAGGERRYWTTGLWDDEIFANLPEMRSGSFVGVPYAPNASVNFFSYHDRVPLGIHNFALDMSGQMHRRQWSDTAGDWNLYCSEPHDTCAVLGACGPFAVCSKAASPPACRCPAGFAPRVIGEWRLGNMASGCDRRRSLPADCHTDGFLELPYAVQLPDGSTEEAAGARSGRACELSCSRDCSCSAYIYDGEKCSVWKGEVANIRRVSDDGRDNGVASVVLHLRVTTSEVPSTRSSKISALIHGRGVAAAAVILLTSLAVIVVPVVVILRRWRRGTGKVMAVQPGSLLMFDYRAVKEATRHFSEKLGSGGFGSVFRGALPDARPVAVKKLDGWHQGQCEKQFRAEVLTLGTIHHVNLVRLRGFCSEGSKRALVYDYMANGSLDSHLFQTSLSSRQVLSWGQRFGIAVGVARGLAYLHDKCRERIIHCDIKPENILLDESLGAKLADFGMAKLVGRGFSRVLTTVRGTPGYLAPEWLAGAPVTVKADVYSFGLVLFELVSGRRNAAASPEEAGGRPAAVYFPVHAAVRLHAGDVVSLLDVRLCQDANVVELERLCKVACWCIQDEECDRPAMGLVVQQLEGVADVALPPIPSRLHTLSMLNGSVSGVAEDKLYFQSYVRE
jgi:hypothetical protein